MQQAAQAKQLEIDRTRRTAQLLAYYRGHANERALLHGALCIAHPFKYPSEDYTLADSVFDGLMIATRMDELTAETRAAIALALAS